MQWNYINKVSYIENATYRYFLNKSRQRMPPGERAISFITFILVLSCLQRTIWRPKRRSIVAEKIQLIIYMLYNYKIPANM